MTQEGTGGDSAVNRNAIDLTGLWRFQPDAFEDGERMGYHSSDLDTRLWREVGVPCAFDDCIPQMAAYEGMGWFRRTFDAPVEWLAGHVVLQFEGVNYNTAVWVNGQWAGAHEGGFLRFELPVRGLLAAGCNVIAVRVDNTRRHGQAPGRERGWRPYGGILRELRLIRRPLLRLERPVIAAGAAGSYHASISVRNDTTAARNVAIALSIVDAAGSEVAAAQSEAREIAGGTECAFEVNGSAASIQAWSPDQPALYEANFRLHDEDSSSATAAGTMADAPPLLDEVSVVFGFRTIERRGTSLLLNGRPLHLQGFNRHEDSPHTGMAPDTATVERDLRHMKELGANFVRMCHYPHHPLELDLCDRLGLLVMGEIPLYWWNGDADGTQPAAVKLAAAKRQLREMIARDINHPCVILWSVSNETEERRPEVAAGNAALIELARNLDATRLVAHVSSHWVGEPHFEQDDVLCVNGYPSWDGRGWKSNPAYDVNDSTRWWDERLAALHAAYPDRPILISEFGYPALYRVYGNGLGEDMQMAALQAEAGAFDKPYVCGRTIWCYADHPWPEEPFINRMTNSPFGIVTRDRRRKGACDTVRAIFGAASVTRPATDSLENWPVRMFRAHLRDIPVAPFRDGYGVRPLQRNEGGLWEDIWRDAEPFAKIDNGLFNREFGDAPGAIERRCYIITAPDGVAAGTISSWYTRDINGLDYGRIHWVATRKAYQGRGIMRAGLSYALLQMAQWHERAMLDTSTGRIGAIKLYLDYGFTPDLTGPRAREAWEMFRRKLDHPALAVLDV
ncbi:MAG: GNAT family N-acetyltransferase [Chloroflexi bacterium]|nr:GNAT family N-acetyltransferase [Chloroflexota bacterium]MCL5273632.1 GNAT family N-acetyltransferase [Chloroflexota bacterium]